MRGIDEARGDRARVAENRDAVEDQRDGSGSEEAQPEYRRRQRERDAGERDDDDEPRTAEAQRAFGADDARWDADERDRGAPIRQDVARLHERTVTPVPHEE